MPARRIPACTWRSTTIPSLPQLFGERDKHLERIERAARRGARLARQPGGDLWPGVPRRSRPRRADLALRTVEARPGGRRSGGRRRLAHGAAPRRRRRAKARRSAPASGASRRAVRCRRNYVKALQDPRPGVRAGARRHRQDLSRGRHGGGHADERPGRADHPVAPGGRGRRAAGLPAGRPEGEGRSLSAPALRRAPRHADRRAGDETDILAARSRSRLWPSCAAARWRTPLSFSTRRRTPPRCR